MLTGSLCTYNQDVVYTYIPLAACISSWHSFEPFRLVINKLAKYAYAKLIDL